MRAVKKSCENEIIDPRSFTLLTPPGFFEIRRFLLVQESYSL